MSVADGGVGGPNRRKLTWGSSRPHDTPPVQRRVKLALVWVLSLAFVGWLLWTTDLDQVKAALSRADLGELIAIMVGTMIVAYVADAATLVLLLRRLLVPDIAVKDVFAIKGVSYFFNALNYSLAAGAIALFVKKKEGVGFLSALSAMMWLSFIDVLVLAVMLSVGVGAGLDLLPPQHAELLPWILAVVAAIAVGAFIYWNLGFDWFILGRLRGLSIFEAFRRAKLEDYAVLMAARLGFVLVYVVMTRLALLTFDIDIGFVPLLVYVPLLTLMQVVPTQISGLGAIQEVMILLFAPFAVTALDPRAEVFAYSLATGPVMALLRLVIGYLFISNVARDFAVTQADIEEAQAEA